MLRRWAKRLDYELWALQARLPDRRASDLDRAMQAEALRRLEVAHAALRQAEVACSLVVKAETTGSKGDVAVPLRAHEEGHR